MPHGVELTANLGPSQLWTPMEFRGFLVAAEDVLLEEDDDEPTLFCVRPGPGGGADAPALPHRVVAAGEMERLVGEHRDACVAHHAAPTLGD